MNMEAKLLELIHAWKMCRHPRIAILARAVAKRCPVRQPLQLSGKILSAKLAAWKSLEERQDPLDFSILLSSVSMGNSDDVARHIRKLALWNDPRFASGLIQLLESPPFVGRRSQPMFETLLRALEETEDVTQIEDLQRLAKRYLSIVYSGTGRFISENLSAIADRFANKKVANLTKDVANLCASVEAQNQDSLEQWPPKKTSEKRTIQELTQVVYTHVSDDSARLVLADALIEQGDERGEFIALQIAEKSRRLSKVERLRLQELHASKKLMEWAHPLSLVGHVLFRRGFPHTVYPASKRELYLDDASWRTVRSVNVEKLTLRSAESLLRAPHAENIRAVERAGSKLLKAVADHTWNWTSLDAVIDTPGFPHALGLSLPKLSSLTVQIGLPLERDALGQSFLAFMTQLKKLSVIEYANSSFQERDLFRFSKLKSLSLDWGGEMESMPYLPPSLERLSIHTPKLNPRLWSLHTLPQLQHLQLRMNLPEDVQQEFLRSLSSLTSLEILETSRLNPALFSGVESQLEKLSLSGFSDERTRSAVCQLKALKQLKVDMVDGEDEFSQLSEIAMKLPQLHSLHITLARTQPDYGKRVCSAFQSSAVQRVYVRPSMYHAPIKYARNTGGMLTQPMA